MLENRFRPSIDERGRLASCSKNILTLRHLNHHDNPQAEMLALFGINSSGKPIAKAAPISPSFASLVSLISQHDQAEAALWDLASILFDPHPSQDHAYLIELDRMALLNQWLVKILPGLSTSLEAFPILVHLVLRNDLEAAAKEAIDRGSPRLAALISIGHADHNLRRACFEAQLVAWHPYSHRIPREHLLIVQLLAGQFDQIDELCPESETNNSWLFKVAIRFWYGLASRPAERLSLVINFAHVDDIRFSLLKYYLQMNYILPGQEEFSLQSCLNFSAFSPAWSLLDISRISWILFRILSPFHEKSSAILDANLAEQLEAAGRPDLALCLLPSPPRRLDLIIRNYPSLMESPQLDQRSRDFMQAKAYYLASSNAPHLEQFLAFTVIQDWTFACHLLARHIGPNCIVNRDDQTLYHCLSKLPTEFLESSHINNVDKTIVAIIYGFMSIRMQTGSEHSPDLDSLQQALHSAIDSIRTVPQAFIQTHLMVRVMLSEITRSLLLMQVPGAPEVPTQSLPLASDSRVALAYQSIVDML